MRDYNELLTVLRACTSKDVGCMKCPRLSTKSFANDCAMSAVRDAADAIEELLAAEPQWVSVEERLPEESGYTIVYCADGDRRHVTFAKYQKTPKRWELTGARSYWRVLKWMPLPKAPKEVE